MNRRVSNAIRIGLSSAMLAVLYIPVLVSAQFTLGKVQSSITEGMDQAEVAAAIGAPNIVTQDAKGNETWIYDKISTTVTESEQSQGSRDTTAGGVGFGIGVGKSILGLGGGTSHSLTLPRNGPGQPRKAAGP